MDLRTFVARLRDHYVEQFRRFADGQRRTSVKGSSEVKLKLDEPSEIYGRFYCVDFIKVKGNGETQVVELQPRSIITFEPVTASFGNASLLIEQFQWDDVLIHHDLDQLSAKNLAGWFHRWFDPDDEHIEAGAELSKNIHSLAIETNPLSIDFGTAEPAAFFEMLELLESAGASKIRVSTSVPRTDAR